MTGPEHYREAERLTANAHQMLDAAGNDTAFDEALAAAQPILARAQIHATLALAAAHERIASTTRPSQTHGGDQFVYDAIGKAELDRLRSLLSHSDRDRLSTWEVVEIAADELHRAKAGAS